MKATRQPEAGPAGLTRLANTRLLSNGCDSGRKSGGSGCVTTRLYPIEHVCIWGSYKCTSWVGAFNACCWLGWSFTFVSKDPPGVTAMTPVSGETLSTAISVILLGEANKVTR